MSSFLDISRRRDAITKVSLSMPLWMFEELEEASKIIGKPFDKIILNLINEFLKEIKSQGYDLTPTYIKKLKSV